MGLCESVAPSSLRFVMYITWIRYLHHLLALRSIHAGAFGSAPSLYVHRVEEDRRMVPKNKPHDQPNSSAASTEYLENDEKVRFIFGRRSGLAGDVMLVQYAV
jgi:hypothetical protein